MNRYKKILFDLDGTISDPKEGIVKSVQYALEKLGIIEENLNNLEGFIGPPLQDSFAEFYHFDSEKSQQAIDFYREKFKETGMFENKLYPQIPKLLKTLKEQNHTLIVATSKPTIFSEKIIKYFNIELYFDLVVGSNLDGTRTSKTEIIQYILDRFPGQRLEDFIMIGDRKHDIIGAHNSGIDSVGVTYGYGSFEELFDSNPTYLVDSVDQILDLLLKSNKILETN